jgi:hypothetical protein
MPADLAALLAQRNARFRAWRAFGVPTESKWEWFLTEEQKEAALLRIICGRCRHRENCYSGHEVGSPQLPA